MAKSANHTHKLKKHKYKTGNSVFFCTLPSCHYKIEVPLAVGKESLCNICGEPFILNETSLKLVRPHCSNCGRREVKDAEGRKHYVKKIGNNILSDVAADHTQSLKERLEAITAKSTDINGEADKDI